MPSVLQDARPFFWVTRYTFHACSLQATSLFTYPTIVRAGQSGQAYTGGQCLTVRCASANVFDCLASYLLAGLFMLSLLLLSAVTYHDTRLGYHVK